MSETNPIKKPAPEQGVVANDEASTTALPALVTQAEMNERNRQYWEQPGGQFKKNDY